MGPVELLDTMGARMELADKPRKSSCMNQGKKSLRIKLPFEDESKALNFQPESSSLVDDL